MLRSVYGLRKTLDLSQEETGKLLSHGALAPDEHNAQRRAYTFRGYLDLQPDTISDSQCHFHVIIETQLLNADLFR